jgi:hypothetical protein
MGQYTHEGITMKLHFFYFVLLLLYLIQRARRLKISTLEQRKAAIAAIHKESGLADPCQNLSPFSVGRLTDAGFDL